MADIKLLGLFEAFQQLMEGSAIVDRVMNKFQTAIQKYGITEDEITRLKALDPTLKETEPTPEGGEMVGQKAGKYFEWILSRYITELKPKRFENFGNMEPDARAAAIENQRAEIIKQKKMFWEDMDKWGVALEAFETFGSKFPKKLNDYTNLRDLYEDSVVVKNKFKSEPTGVENTAWGTKKAVWREKYGAKGLFLGSVVGYDVYEIPKSTSPQEIDFAYSMSCEIGKDTHWCTRHPKGDPNDHLQSYIKTNSLYVFVGKSPEDRYQFYYGDANGSGAMFMDSDDVSIFKSLGEEEEAE